MWSNVPGKYIGTTDSAIILLPAATFGKYLKMTGAGFPLILDLDKTSRCTRMLFTR